MVKVSVHTAEDSTDPRIGAVVDGRYRILQFLAGGAMGVVYRGERLQLGRQVAIKFLHAPFAGISDFAKRFEQEARAMSRLEHPHCVSVMDFGISGSPYIVMEYVTGTTLRDVMDEGPMALPRASHLIRQLLAGLAHAHEQGIIHRDIKPANLMLTDHTGTGDHLRILDFGLAKLADSDQSMTSIVVGTPNYMSPEQASAAKLDARSDIYSSGIVLYELLTGCKPFQADDTHEILRLQREEQPPSLAELCPNGTFSAELEQLVRRVLSKSANDRFQTAMEFADALGALGDPGNGPPLRARLPALGLADTAAVPVTPPARERAASPAPGSRRGRSRRWLIGLLVISALTLWLLRGMPGAPDSWKTRSAGWLDSLSGKSGGAGDAVPPDSAAATTIEAIERNIAAGEREGALRDLHRLRRAKSDDPRVPLLIGDLYFHKGADWWSEALAAYAEALRSRPAYAERAALVERVIEALADERSRSRARTLLVQIGKPARSHLTRAVKKASDPAVRAQAREILQLLD